MRSFFKLIMLKPRNLPFTFRIIKEMILSRVFKYPNPAFLVKDYIFETAIRENPKSVLDTMDNFARNNRFLMNVGNEKGALLVEEIVKLGPEINVLELGSFCGYSSILMAMNMDQKSQITSLEINGKYAKIAREIIEFSGLSNKIVIKVGASGNLIPKLKKKFDLIFIDHWKDLYKRDLIIIEEHNLIKQGSIIFADNVGPLFGNKDYLQYVRNNKKFVSRNVASSVEYSSAEDAVEISIYQG